MAITYHKIDEIDPVEFDYILNQTMPTLSLGNNFKFPDACVTDSEKKEFFAGIVLRFVNNVPSKFMFKVMDDDLIVALSVGYIDINGVLFGMWHLLGPNKSGTRRWVFKPETAQLRYEFFLENGIEFTTVYMPDTSTVGSIYTEGAQFEVIEDTMIDPLENVFGIPIITRRMIKSKILPPV